MSLMRKQSHFLENVVYLNRTPTSAAWTQVGLVMRFKYGICTTIVEIGELNFLRPTVWARSCCQAWLLFPKVFKCSAAICEDPTIVDVIVVVVF